MDLESVPSLYPKGCLTCGGRNNSVLYHGERHICHRCQRGLQTYEIENEDCRYVDVFLSKSGQIVVLKKQSQNDESTKMLFIKEESQLYEQLKSELELRKLQHKRASVLLQSEEKAEGVISQDFTSKRYSTNGIPQKPGLSNLQRNKIPKNGNPLLPRSKNFEYGDYMNLKIYGLECYATLAGDGNLVVLLKDF